MTLPVSRPAPVAVKPLAVAIAIAAVFPSCAFAQVNQEKMLTPVVVTATRSPQYARDVLSDNIVITSEEIAQSSQASIVDLLQRQRGIEIMRNGGPGTSSSVFIRGADDKQNIVLVDGVRIGSSTTGSAAWAAIPLGQIDHIEIVYGPLSSMYGADAIGGVVQIFTKKGEGAPHVAASAGVGSYATRTIDAGISGATSGEHRLRYAITAAHEHADGFSATTPGNSSYNPDKDGYQKDSASGQFSLDVAKGHELGFVFLHSRLDAQFDNKGPTYDARTLHTLGNHALYAKNRLLPGWTSHLQVSQAADKSGTDSSAAASGKSQFDTTQTDISWQNNVTLGTDMLQLLVEQRKEKVESSSTPALTGQRTTNSAAASYQLKRGAHLASVSVRNDNSSQYGANTTGSAGYGYRITSGFRASASFGTSFRAPTFNELYFPNFGVASNKPEQGKNAEAGLYYEDGLSQVSAVYYRNRITDLLVKVAPCPDASVSAPLSCAYNVNKALLTGVSLGASTRLGNFTVRGAVDLQNPRDETTDKVLYRRARRHASAALEYHAGAIKAGAETVLSGRRFDDAANKNTLGGYGLLNLYASYDVAPGWSLFGRWNNVGNKNYALAKNYATAGSNLFVGVRYGME